MISTVLSGPVRFTQRTLLVISGGLLMVLLAVNFDNLHQILQSLYTDMMPLCSQMTGVAKGLAGLGALFYVAYRVWQSLARGRTY